VTLKLAETSIVVDEVLKNSGHGVAVVAIHMGVGWWRDQYGWDRLGPGQYQGDEVVVGRMSTLYRPLVINHPQMGVVKATLPIF